MPVLGRCVRAATTTSIRRSSRRAVTREDALPAAGAPLRTDGRHAGARRSSPASTICGSSRTPARRTAPSATAFAPERPASPPPSASTRPRISAQQVMQARSSPTTETQRRMPAHSASTARSRSTRRRTRATRPASTRCRRSCSATSCRYLRGWNAERAAVAAATPRRSQASAISAAAGAGRQLARLAPLRRPHGEARGARGVSRRAWDRDGAALPGACRTCRRRSGGSATGRARSPLRRRWRRSSSRCRSSRASPASSSNWLRLIRAFFAGA